MSEFGSSQFIPSPDVRVIAIGEQRILFDERNQQLSQLNATAALIWRGLSEGFSCDDIAQHLLAMGASRNDAAEFVTHAIEDWLAASHIVPVEAVAALRSQRYEAECVRLGPLTVELRFFAGSDRDTVMAVFGHLSSADGEARRDVVSVVRHAGHDFLFLGDGLMGKYLPSQTVPALKAFLTEEYCSAVSEGFVAHGALVSSNGRSVYLSGEPGAGKSTLTLALAAREFAYGSDDLVHIGADGKATGVAFAAAAKPGAWPHLEPYVPQLDALPVYERGDGQLVRYVLPERLSPRTARPIDIAIVLDRRDGAETALKPISPVDMLCVLLDCGYSRHKAIAAPVLENLANNMARARSFRLTYDGLAEAVAAIERLIDE